MNRLEFFAAECCRLFTACENDTKSKIEELENRIEGLENGGNSNTGNDTNQNGGNSNTGSDNATDTANGHGYVDLGLPSGTKWATCNVGAATPEEYGNYYAWGETEPKETYYWNTYKWATAPYDAESDWWNLETLTKYNTGSVAGIVDNKTVLELADDAARANWGGQWRMPTDAEWTELRENCTWTWTTLNGKNGYEVKGANGNSIFLPAAGNRYDDVLCGAGNVGYYWSSSLRTDYPYAWCVSFDSDNVSRYGYGRCCGLSVRPVLGE